MLKILADRAIPHAHEIFSRFGEVTLKAGRQITSEDLKGVDALMVRSVTRIDDDLLKGADSLRFVGTATAGTDHVDRGALASRDIMFSAAYGCNSASVCDYVLSVLLVMAQRHDLNLSEKTLGIIGCGHVGLRVYVAAKALGMRVVCCDPPRRMQLIATRDPMFGRGDPKYAGKDEMYAAAALLSDGDEFLCRSEFGDPDLFRGSLDDALKCDIITLHTPLVTADVDGEHPTYHMIGAKELERLGDGQILINASRGAVVDNRALYDALLRRRGEFFAWLDVFENEPALLVRELLPLLEGCTPHIAGYALEAKNRGTAIIAGAFKEMLRLDGELAIPKSHGDISKLFLSPDAVVDQELLSRLVFSVYDVRRDDALFRRRFTDGRSFDSMRACYRERHELNTLRVFCETNDQIRSLYNLGFKVLHA